MNVVRAPALLLHILVQLLVETTNFRNIRQTGCPNDALEFGFHRFFQNRESHFLDYPVKRRAAEREKPHRHISRHVIMQDRLTRPLGERFRDSKLPDRRSAVYDDNLHSLVLLIILVLNSHFPILLFARTVIFFMNAATASGIS